MCKRFSSFLPQFIYHPTPLSGGGYFSTLQEFNEKVEKPCRRQGCNGGIKEKSVAEARTLQTKDCYTTPSQRFYEKNP